MSTDQFMAQNPNPDERELEQAGASDDPVSRFFALAVRLHRLADYRATQSLVDQDSSFAEATREAKELFQGLADVIRTYYAVEDTLGKLEFVEIGTTSIILQDPGSPLFVYKCVLPRYTKMNDIRATTAGYEKTIDRVRAVGLEDRVPAVVAGNERYTKQQYFSGLTLEEYLLEFRSDLHEPTQRDALRAVVEKLGTGLCDILALLSANGQDPHHLDIAPSNIILKSRKNVEFDAQDVCLIDFGKNFLLEDSKVGAYSAYQHASMYIAPEVQKIDGVASATSDAFSVGMVMLDVLTCSGKPPRQTLLERLFGRLVPARRRKDPRNEAIEVVGLTPETTEQALEAVYRDSPRLAALIEDAIEPDSRNRLTLIRRQGLEQLFSTMKATIEHTCAIDAMMPGPDEHGKSVSPRRVLRVVLSGLALDGVFALFHTVRRTRRAQVDKLPGDVVKIEGAWWLPILAGLVAGEWLLVLLAGILFQGCDIYHAFPRRNWVADVARHIPYRSHAFVFPTAEEPVAHLWRANLGGRLTAITFAFIAARYYLNIFSSLPLRAAQTSFGVVKRTALAATGTVSPLICMLGILYPLYWPLFGAAGSIFIVWNNLNIWLLARRALKKIKPGPKALGVRSRDPLKRFESTFQEWWVLFGLYGAALGGLGAMNLLGWVHDLLFDAVIVAVINYVKLYRTNCHGAAPMVRGSIARALNVLRRTETGPASLGSPASETKPASTLGST